MMECSPDCVKLLDHEGRVCFFNANGLRAMEIESFASVKGAYWPSLWPEENRDDARQAFADALKGATGSFTGFCPTAKGTAKWWDVLVTAVPTSDGPPKRLLVISRDITTRMEQEALNQAAHERLALISAVTNDVLWDIDLATKNVWWGEGISSVFGYGREQVGHDTTWRLQRMHPEDRQRVADSMRLACENGSIHWQSAFRYLKADGDYAHVNDRGIIVRDKAGKAARFMGAMQDVSAQRAMEERQERLARELAHRVNNTLSVVQGLVRQTSRHSADIKTFADAIEQRLTAMGSATVCLLNGNWASADLEELATMQLAPFMGKAEPQILIKGPRVSIDARSAQSLALAFNELATNAIKYGALSLPSGQAKLSWSVESDASERMLSIVWQERGGPPIRSPTKRSFGTTLIERGIPDAHVCRTFDPEGLTCSIRLSLR
jgi:PAS domain S-box-containing protein